MMGRGTTLGNALSNNSRHNTKLQNTLPGLEFLFAFHLGAFLKESLWLLSETVML